MAANQIAHGRRRSRIAAGSDRFEKLYDLLARLAACPNLEAVLGEVLDASLAFVSADAGYIRMFERGLEDPVLSSYPFVVHRGLSRPYLDYFSRLSQPVDRTARRSVFAGRRVYIDDMFSHAAFEAHRAVVIDEGYKSLQASPMMSQHGSRCVGVICAYFRAVHQPSETELETLDLYSELAASAIDQHVQIEELARRERMLTTVCESTAELLSWISQSLEDANKHAANLESLEAGVSASAMMERIASGQAELLATTLGVVLPSELDSEVGDGPYGLSSPEIEALLTAQSGLSDSKTAGLLGISRLTLAKQRGGAMRKLGVTSTDEAAAFMHRRRNDSSGEVPFSDLLRSFRLRAGLTQAELAQMAKLSYRTISDLERGVRRKTYGSTVALLCNALELNPEDSLLLASSVDRSRTPRTTRAS